MEETATIHRYQGHDEDRFGIPDGALVAVTPADYDDEKVIVWFTLSDLRNPECAAYLTDIGPCLGTMQIVEQTEKPYGMKPAAPDQVPAVIEAAEGAERLARDLLGRPDIAAALATLIEAGVSGDQYERALAVAAG